MTDKSNNIIEECWKKLLSTENIPKKKQSETIKKIYHSFLDKTTPPVIFVESPRVAFDIMAKDSVLSRNKHGAVRDIEYRTYEIQHTIFDTIAQKVFDSVLNPFFLYKEMLPEMDVLKKKIDTIFEEMFDPYANHLLCCEKEESLCHKIVHKSVAHHKELISEYHELIPFLRGSLLAPYIGIIDIIREKRHAIEINSDTEQLIDILRQTIDIGFIYPFDHICLVSQKPILFNVVEDDHTKNMTIEYSDGFKVHYVRNKKP